MKGGLDLSVSTIVLFVLGIFVLIGLIVMVNYGFLRFKSDTGDVFNTIDYKNAERECLGYCSDLMEEYCCEEYEIQGNVLECSDIIDCDMDCSEVVCNG